MADKTLKIYLVDGTYELFRNHFGAPPKKVLRKLGLPGLKPSQQSPSTPSKKNRLTKSKPRG